MNKTKITLISTVFLVLLFFFFPLTSLAQEFSLSVTPPITEILIKPGTEVNQIYQISNNGEAGLYSIRIFPFSPNGDSGEININEQADTNDNPENNGWFSLLQPQVRFGEKFNIPTGSNTTVVIRISVPPEAVQKDYYYMVIFQSESEKGIGESFSQSRGRIGSNLLISVVNDENPFRLAEIKEFSAPLIVDSLAKINYSVILKNVGRTLFKPDGKIAVSNVLSKKETALESAPQNVLAYSERKISCLDGEDLIDCELPSKVLLGLYKAKLSFKLDGQDKIYQAQVNTLALPFSLVVVLAVISIIFTIIAKRLNLSRK
jgi:hypothetical protein